MKLKKLLKPKIIAGTIISIFLFVLFGYFVAVNTGKIGSLQTGDNDYDSAITYAKWDTLQAEQKKFFYDRFGGNEEKGKHLYYMYFLKYNLVHETSHVIRYLYPESITNSNSENFNFYADEKAVNEIAVAYWRSIGQQDFINELKVMVQEAVSTVPNPVPTDKTPENYFNEQYASNMPSIVYGYFQFNFVLSAINSNQTFEEVLKNNVTKKFTVNTTKITHDYGDIYQTDSQKVVKDYVEYLKSYNVKTPRILRMRDRLGFSLQYVEPCGYFDLCKLSKNVLE